jgi:hypothetical protein
MKQTSNRNSKPHHALIREMVLKFPNTPKQTLAKKFVKENPKFLLSVEEVRDYIRTITGSHGSISREFNVDFRTELAKLKKAMPKGDTEREEPYHIPKANRNILVIGDLHIPYHNDEAIFAALEYGAEQNVDTIIINGDLLDFALISRHEKDLRKRSVGYEIAAAKIFLEGLRNMFPKALIINKNGNHCVRYQKWIMQKAPELLDIEGTSLPELLGLNQLNIINITDKRYIYAGKIAIFHGHEVGMTSGGVNPARTLRLKLNKSAITNHFHRETKDMGRSLDEQPYSCYSNACLCDLYPAYMPINQWTHGFIHLKLDKHGNYNVQQKSIIDGVIY